MKKNIMMRLASTTAVMVMLTTCIVSGTYAKYTTSTEASDSARIAKWGIGAPADLDLELFATNAFNDGKVSSSDADNVVAPGTSHEQTINLFTITGEAPEVMYNYEVEMTVNPEASTTIDVLDAIEGFKWTLKAPGADDAESFDTFAELQAAVNDLSETNIAPNTLPEGFADGDNTMVIGWEWTFEVGDTDAAIAANDVVDTKAGDDSAAGELDTFTITLTISATQVD